MLQKFSSIALLAIVVFYPFLRLSAQTAGTPPAATTPAQETVAPTDTTPPTISGVTTTSVGIHEVTIVWSTDEAAVSSLEYGTTTAYGQSATLPATALLGHTATLTDLSASTTYHYCVHATDTASNTASSCGHTLTTEAATATEPVIADSDSDGISDAEEIGTAVTEESSPEAAVTNPEAFPDTDHDGTPNYLDPDDDGDTVPTIDDGTITNDPVEPVDTDHDGIPNYLDSNDDGDAIPTANEETIASPNPEATDTDGDTIPDYLESNTADTDHDGVADVNDSDDDGDSVPTSDEVITDTSDTDAAVNEAIVDIDHDGTPNALDPDDDGDDTLTINEDTNHDGSVLDDDTDGDSIPDFEEPNNVDTDSDGSTNNIDSDDDGDTVPTKQKAVSIPSRVISKGSGSSSGGYYYVPPIDTDGDGIPDHLDTNDDNDSILTKNETGDTESDNIPDYKESNNRDLDNDGKNDVADNEDDGDGIVSTLDSNPYSESCYAPAELGNTLYVVLPNGTKRTAGEYANKTVLADNIIRYDFELGTNNDFNDLSVRVNDEGHRSFIATVLNANVRTGYKVHLEILGNGAVEKDLTLWTNPSSAKNIPQRIEVSQFLKLCSDHDQFCPAHITQYMKKGVNNDPVEVSKLQSFLVDQEGFAKVQVTGVFDDTTDAAVRAFQEKHASIILGPWAIQKGTGYVYRTTIKRINDLYCARPGR